MASTVAGQLMSLDNASRLALRNHPAIAAFALLLEITNAVATNQALAQALALDRALDRALDLDRARHDFTGADLSGVNLSRVSLTGIRWSMDTRWASDEWRAQALLDSRDLGDGTYEIQAGTTDVRLHRT